MSTTNTNNGILDPNTQKQLNQQYQKAINDGNQMTPATGYKSQDQMNNYINNMKGPVDLSQHINPTRDAQLTQQYLSQMNAHSTETIQDRFWNPSNPWLQIFTYVLILILVISIIMFFFKKLNRKKSTSYQTLEILQQRYAKGEIDKETFNQMKRDLYN